MQYTGTLKKMRVSTDTANQAQYQLPVGDNLIDMNALIGQPVSVSYSGNIFCVHCQRKTKKSFNQGYCYPCLISLAQCDSCIIKPEKCHYHEGTCREPQWGEEHCFSDHFVYLANTGNLKVGITRHVTDGISSRWIDQGASQATVMLRVPDRLTSGRVEQLCTRYIGDKTNWRTMLKGAPQQQDLIALKHDMLEKLAPELEEIISEKGLQAVTTVDDLAHQIAYPVNQYPEKIKSINLDKENTFSGTLTGIKGQYWMLDGDRVINIRKYAGYEVLFEA
ncbi:DUF2797 domain-containing protein [Alteromonas lipolytica]|uniref:DUF2797 domain-containing protein n=1 Tax=Alteromonas lipolytica TaxID=1856405 RepID=A0A1E8FGI2_9ALTE|nr:DUF2797 domain-containing protein [Alteromonas lipolytica]OFI35019.1 hypothetical protein BFC17_15795 [Alteromonas lipolytica]GGF55938.1 hypothetical protein GCM10011338_05280 [Alteromonas lipolytica]